MKRLRKLSLIVVMLLVATMLLSPGLAIAKDNSKNGQGKPGKVGSTAVTSMSFYFSPNPTSAWQWTYPYHSQHLVTYALADARLEMLINPYYRQPLYNNGNVPHNGFSYQYNGSYGGNCWRYDSGVIWYTGTYDIWLQAATYSAYRGSFKHMAGSSWYIPDAWKTYWSTVN